MLQKLVPRCPAKSEVLFNSARLLYSVSARTSSGFRRPGEIELRTFFLFLGLAAAGAASLRSTAADLKTAPPSPSLALRVLSDAPLPPDFERASDVRWATDQSVYLAVATGGTFEFSLDPAGPRPKEMIPAGSSPEGFWESTQLAASSSYLVAAGPESVLTWRRLQEPTREEEPFDFIQALDVQENRVAILGGRRDPEDDNQTDGAIAWIGDLDRKLTDLRPVHYDSAEPGTPKRGRCGSLPSGVVRFLPEGSLLVVPGAPPGISLLDRGGRLIRTWDTASLGIDAICGGRNDELQARYEWLNRWRTVDTLLPFPGGPGLVVRRAENGHTRWDLKILKLDGTAQTFALPFEGGSEFFHIKGDVRAGKIVFVLWETVFEAGERMRPTAPRLIVAERAWPEEHPVLKAPRMPISMAAPQPFPSGVPPVVASSAPAVAPTSLPASPATASAFGILSDITLPAAFEWASDVRWASDKSVYLGVGFVGTFEVSLDAGGPPPKEMIPGRSKPGGYWASQKIAGSSRFLAAAGPALSVTWRPIADPAREEEPFDFIQALDVQDNRLAILGARRSEDGLTYAPDGAIAWIGSLDKKLADLRPVLYDISGPGARNMGRCGSVPLGAVRFLPDGSLVVAAGVQAGVNQYDRDGKLIRTWDTPPLGIDAACGGMTDDVQAHRIVGRAASRNAWLNQWRTIDTLLPLPEGPGLVVRRAENGRTRWDLKILRVDGAVQSVSIPIEGSSEFFHLESDVRGGMIVFLLRETVFKGGEKDHPAPPRLIVVEPLPNVGK